MMLTERGGLVQNPFGSLLPAASLTKESFFPKRSTLGAHEHYDIFFF